MRVVPNNVGMREQTHKISVDVANPRRASNVKWAHDIPTLTLEIY